MSGGEDRAYVRQNRGGIVIRRNAHTMFVDFCCNLYKLLIIIY